MRRFFLSIVLIGLVALSIWAALTERKSAFGPTVKWRDEGWAEARVGSNVSWNRKIQVTNTGSEPCIGEVYCFVGEKPSDAFLEACAARAVAAINLEPGETVATGVWCNDKPAADVKVLAFSCSAAELERKRDMRRRYPVLKRFLSLPHKVVTP